MSLLFHLLEEVLHVGEEVLEGINVILRSRRKMCSLSAPPTGALPLSVLWLLPMATGLLLLHIGLLVRELRLLDIVVVLMLALEMLGLTLAQIPIACCTHPCAIAGGLALSCPALLVDELLGVVKGLFVAMIPLAQAHPGRGAAIRVRPAALLAGPRAILEVQGVGHEEELRLPIHSAVTAAAQDQEEIAIAAKG